MTRQAARQRALKDAGKCATCTHATPEVNPRTGQRYRHCLPCRRRRNARDWQGTRPQRETV